MLEVVEVMLRQCFAQSRLCGGSSATLTEVKGICSLCFSTCEFMLVFFPGKRIFQADFLSFSDLWWGNCLFP